MSRIRIRCIPYQPVRSDPEPGYPTINGCLAQWTDMEILLIDDNGYTHPILPVSKVEFFAQQGTEPPRAVLHIIGPELEIDGVKVEFMSDKPQPESHL